MGIPAERTERRLLVHSARTGADHRPLCAGQVPAASIWFPHRARIATMPLRYFFTMVGHAGWIAQAMGARPGDAMSKAMHPGTDSGILALAEATRLQEGVMPCA